MHKIVDLIESKLKAIIAIIVSLMVIVGVVAGLAARYEYVNSEAYYVQGLLNSRKASSESGEDIDFNVFFLRDTDGDGKAEEMDEITQALGNTDYMFVELNNKSELTLKDARFYISDSNFKWKTAIIENNIIKQDYIGYTNSIEFKDFSTGSQILVYGKIESSIGNNINDYDKNSKVIFTCTVEKDGTEKIITRECDLKVNWYGTTSTYIYNPRTQNYNIDQAIKQNSFDVNFDFEVRETKQELLMQKQEVEIEIPQLNGYNPTSVTCTSASINQEYDTENRILKISREAKVDENGRINRSVARYNNYYVTVIYPIEAYQSMGTDSVLLSMKVNAKNYGYNNPNKENPYVSSDNQIINVVYRKITPSQPVKIPTWSLNTTIGTYMKQYGDYWYDYYISKEGPQNIYNGNIYNDEKDSYPVTWQIGIGDYKKIKSIQVEDDEYNKFNGSESMENYVTTSGIYFSNAKNVLGENGKIYLYDSEDTLIEIFDKSNWEVYTKDNPYEANLKKIKIVTTSPVSNSYLYVYQIKEINDEILTDNMTPEHFSSLYNIYTYTKGSIEAQEGATLDNGDSTWTITNSERALYELPYSIVNLGLDKKEIANLRTENINLTITTSASSTFEKKWRNGTFLIELPLEIMNAEVQNIEISNENVEISQCVTYVENDIYYIRIDTENTDEELYTIKINMDVMANPLYGTRTKPIKLYAYNPNGDNYIYRTHDIHDIDSDSLATDYVASSSQDIDIIASQGLVTESYISNYDDEGNRTIAPNIAEIDKESGERTATVNISIANNYPEEISNMVILGKIQYEGNTYILNENTLNSQYTTHLTGPMSIPEAMQQYVTVYYSDKETPTKDLNDSNNNWTTNPSDWNTIKSYLIDLGDYVLRNDGNKVFSYEVQIPEGLGYNTVSYATHAAYYSIKTVYGELDTETQASKVGLQAVKKFSLELTKNRAGNDDVFVEGAIYNVTTKDPNGKSIIKKAKTDENGKLLIKGLCIEKEYTLKEISSPLDYALQDNDVKFVVSADDTNGDLQLNFELKDGRIKENPEYGIDANGNNLVKIKVEDEAKYTLFINKKDENGNELNNVKFTIVGKDKANIYKTVEGKIEIPGLYVNKEYELQEIKADGYYIDSEPRTFKIVRNEQTKELEIQTADEELQNITINQTSEGQHNANVTIYNEKIPTYNLQILKIEEPANEDSEIIPLAGAEFKLYSEDSGKNSKYTTDENGYINISNLYTFVDGKNITGNYILQEVKAPEGYSNNAEEIRFKVALENEILNLSIDEENNLKTVYESKLEDNTVKLTIQDKPLFKLTKIDAEEVDEFGNPILLANAQFVIYEIDSNKEIIDYAKDVNGNYVGEINADGEYVVTTNERGTISVPLRAGEYLIKEVGYPLGYLKNSNNKVFKIIGATDELLESSYVANLDDIYEVNYIEDLVDLGIQVAEGKNYSNKTIRLMRSLDFNDSNSYRSGIVDTALISENGFMPIGSSTNSFSGIFDGQGYEISNLYMNRNGSYVGLFGYISNSEINNLGISCNINGGMYTGGIVGYANKSSITKCYSKGEIIGKNYTGGIAGYLYGSSKIDLCYNMCDTTTESNTNNYTGGIIGAGSTVTNSYSIGNVRGISDGNTSYVGGIVGSGTTYNCYYLSTIEIIGDSINSQGYTRLESEMKDEHFIYELGELCWKLDEENYNNGYPILGICYIEELEDIEEINYIEDIEELSIQVQSGKDYNGKTVKLMRNLDFTNEDSYRSGIVDTSLISEDGFMPIGSNGKTFKGIFDGQNNEIRNLFIYRYECYLGLFGYIENAKIINLGVTGNVSYYNQGNYNTTSVYSGLLSGYAIGSIIENCYAEGDLNSDSVKYEYGYNSYGGEIVGYITNISELNNCYSLGNVNNYGYAGGIIGYSINVDKINNCYHIGNIAGFDSVGGIVGNSNYEILINNCYNKGNIKTYKESTGYDYCFAGGIIGGEYSNDITVINCYNIGDVECDSTYYGYGYGSNCFAGGIAGSAETIKNCYNVGNVNSNTDSPYRSSQAGGITAHSRTVTDCFYLNTSEISGASTNQLGKSFTVEEMKNKNFIYELGILNWKKDEDNINSGYPILEITNIEELEDVLEINYIEDLQELSAQVNAGKDYNGKTVKLMRTLDFTAGDSYRTGSVDSFLTSTFGFKPIGTEGNPFKGSFDGQENEIKKMYINRTNSRVGLFGVIQNSNIINLGISGNIFGAENSYVGGIVGYANGNSCISNCNNQCNITGGYYVGGICGYATNSIRNCYNIGILSGDRTGGIAGTIGNIDLYSCYNKGEIIGKRSAGGIVGVANSQARITNCYNTKNITSNGSDNYSCAGGITGNDGTITNCYNIGNISSNIECSQSYSGGITGYSSSAFIYNTYYSDKIEIVGKTIQTGRGKIKSDAEMKDTSFIEILGVLNWKADEDIINYGYPILKITNVEDFDDILEINYIEDLQELSRQVSLGKNYDGKTIKLMRSLDFNNSDSYISEVVDVSLTSGLGFTPIGINEANSFDGIFDGQGYEIKNLYINNTNEYVGLFGIIKDAQIINLGVDGSLNSECKQDKVYVGGIAAFSPNSVITNCYHKGELNTSRYTRVCYVGGISGNSGTISYCYNTGNINVLNGSYCYAGGITGSAGKIEICYNLGNINMAIQNGNGYAGGICGEQGTINSCYNLGNVNNTMRSGYTGNIVGDSTNANVYNSYYLTTMELVGNIKNNFGTARSESQMKSKDFIYDLNNLNWKMDENFINNGYPVFGMVDIEEFEDILEINYIEDLQDLAIQVNSGKSYTNKTIKLMRNLDFADSDSYRSGIVSNYLLTEVGFTPIGIDSYNAFTGNFDGQGFEISSIYINKSHKYVGLFGYIKNSSVKDFTIGGVVKGNYLYGSNSLYVGGISGYAIDSIINNCHNLISVTNEGAYNACTGGVSGGITNSEIIDCYNSGIILCTQRRSFVNVGGISGYTYNSTFSNCYNTNEINATVQDYTDSTRLGGIVGYVDKGKSIFIDCYNRGIINGNGAAGGIIGYDYGYSKSEITNCYNTGIIDGYIVGGIIGYIKESISITNSYNEGTLSGKNNTGGIIGYSNGGSVIQCYNIGEISGSGKVGGIVGSNGCTVSKSYNKGNISISGENAGIAGGISIGGTVNNCYNTGNVISISGGNAGGISIGGTINNCYNIGNVISNDGSVGTITSSGGTINNCYYLNTIELTGSTVTSNGYARNDSQMKDKTMIQYLGISNWKIDEDLINDGYPIFGVTDISEDDDVLEINYIEDLVELSNQVNLGRSYEGKTVKLLRNLDFNDKNSYKNNTVDELLLSNNGFKPIGNTIEIPFKGVFDGQGYEVNNIYINNHNQAGGLFGFILNAKIMNLGVGGSIVINNYDSTVGGIAGYSFGSTISNCYNNANIDGIRNIGGIVGYTSISTVSGCCNYGTVGEQYSNYVGGIVGQVSSSNVIECNNLGLIKGSNDIGGIAGYVISNSQKSIIRNCNNSGTINADQNVGGIIGELKAHNDVDNCYNTGDVNGTRYVGGIIGYSLDNISSCYNIGSINGNQDIGGIIGYGENIEINNCYNTGKITGSYIGGILGHSVNSILKNSFNIGNIVGTGGHIGGIGGYVEYSSISTCYNAGNVSGEDGYSGGITGYILYNSNINDCYNTGEISNTNTVGGISGIAAYGKITNCYNVGVLSAGNEAGGIVAGGYNESKEVSNSFYPNTLNIEARKISSFGEVVTEVEMTQMDFYTKLNEDDVWKYNFGDYPTLAIFDLINVTPSESTELVMENTKRKFYITTSVNRDECGTISGQGEEQYEIIKFGDNNTKPILITPNQGYEITKITINDIELDYKVNEDDGTYIIPAGFFTDVQESKHIYAEFTALDQVLTITKVDEDDNTKLLKDAKFIVEDDFRDDITNELGSWQESGSIYGIPNKDKKVDGVLGELDTLGRAYTFIQNENKCYESNNQGVAGTANARFEIDLTQKEGNYVVVVNAHTSCYGTDVGYATITQNSTSVPSYNTTNGRFIYISGTSEKVNSDRDYNSMVLEGGNKYYLYVGYRKYSSSSSYSAGEDKFTINDINIYEADATSYCFNKLGSKYISNNQNSNFTTANSYIPIDLSDTTGKYDLTVNAEISSEANCDYGYVTITNSEDAPMYSNSNGRIVYISGEQEAKDYKTTLEGGNKYYIHFGYYKDYSVSSGTDTFTVNDVKLDLNKDDYYYEEFTTNSSGQIKAVVSGDSTLKVTEIEAPEGYTKNNTPVTYTMDPTKTNEITITNKEQTTLIVHHYFEGGTNKVAEDEIIKGDIGANYTTEPKLDLDKLTLAKDEDGNLIIPENAEGTYGTQTIEVTYYYEALPVVLTVHHYFEGTEDSYYQDEKIEKIPTIVFSGECDYAVSTDEKQEYVLKDNEVYKNLPEELELMYIQSPIQDEITIDDVLEYTDDLEVTYYYRARQYEYNIHYYYNDDEDEERFVTDTAEFGRSVEYIDKYKKGYKFDRVENNPLVISKYNADNVINVYYVTDENETKDLSYTVEYYKNGSLVKKDTQEEKVTVQYLQPDTIAVDKTKINITDKYLGFKLDIDNTQNIPDVVNNGDIIKIYYITDYSQLKEASYTIEYYKDGNIIEEDTEEKTFTVYVLDEKLPVDKDALTNKYYGFMIDESATGNIPDYVDIGTTLKIYYKTRKYMITTEIAENGLGSREGGSITGNFGYYNNVYYSSENNIRYVEMVKHGQNATKDIVISPYNGYDIISIKVNGEDYDYTIQNNRVTIPKFENVTQDYHIVVRFGNLSKTLKINKEDEDENKLEGAKFQITSDDYLDASSYMSSMNSYDSNYYSFYNNGNDTYVSSNSWSNNSASVSYREIDLSNEYGNYNLIVNAKISSEENRDYGYVVISEEQIGLATSTSTSTSTSSSSSSDSYYNPFDNYSYMFKISGEVESQDYKQILEGGRKYYVYFVYAKDSSSSRGDDRLTINSVKLLRGQQVNAVTDNNGESYIQLDNYGTYTIKEIEAPEHYVLSGEERSIELTGLGTLKEETFINTHKPKVIVHHYFKDKEGNYTTNKVAEDQLFEGNVGQSYSTESLNLNGLNQEKVDDSVVTPNNASGNYPNNGEIVEVNYYYEISPVKLTIHHYKDGTSQSIADDETINQDINITFLANDTYSINSNLEYNLNTDVSYKELLNSYNLIEIVNNTNSNNTLKVTEKLKYNENTEITYYYAEKTYSYIIHYVEQDTDIKLAEDKVIEGKHIGDTIQESAITIEGCNQVEPTSTMIEIVNDSNEYTFYYTRRSDLTYTINYINKETNEPIREAKVVTTGKYQELILADNEIIDILNFEYYSRDKNSIKLNLDSTKNVINLYYSPAYSITTTANEHTEEYRNGTSTSGVTGGTISGQTDEVYENVLSGDDATKNIVITPDEGYQIVRVTITVGEESEDLDIDSYIDEEGKVTINPENNAFLQDVTSNISIEAEFRKKSKVTVRYIDKETNEAVAEEVEIDGLESKEFEPTIPSISGYRRARVSIGSTTEEPPVYLTEVNGEPQYTEMTDANNTMSADPSVLIYWYEPIPEGTILVRHIEVDESDINGTYNLDSGTEISVEEIASLEEYVGQVGTTRTTSRKEFTDSETGRAYISVDGPVSNDENIVVLDKDTDNYTITIEERDLDDDGFMDIQEIRYYYERQYEITVKDKSNEEMVSGLDITVDGGHYGMISGDGENAYELVNRMGSNTKAIEAVPNENYIVKAIKVNGLSIDLTDLTDENGKVTIPAGFFTNIVEDIEVEVFFEKAPGKVIVKYVDKDTNEELDKTIIVGKVDDEYETESKEIEGYELDESSLPENTKGPMTVEDIEVIYYYKKLEKEEPIENPDKPETPQEPEKTEAEEETSNILETSEVIYEEGAGEVAEELDEKEAEVTIIYDERKLKQTNRGTPIKNPKSGDNVLEYVEFLVVSTASVIMIKFKKMIDKKKKDDKNEK